jgi:hypothetical protein
MQGIRPYINPSDIKLFKEDEDLEERKLWWENFTSVANFRRWTPAEKKTQIRSKLRGPVLTWYDQLRDEIKDDWDILSQ